MVGVGGGIISEANSSLRSSKSFSGSILGGQMSSLAGSKFSLSSPKSLMSGASKMIESVSNSGLCLKITKYIFFQIA